MLVVHFSGPASFLQEMEFWPPAISLNWGQRCRASQLPADLSLSSPLHLQLVAGNHWKPNAGGEQQLALQFSCQTLWLNVDLCFCCMLPPKWFMPVSSVRCILGKTQVNGGNVFTNLLRRKEILQIKHTKRQKGCSVNTVGLKKALCLHLQMLHCSFALLSCYGSVLSTDSLSGRGENY